MWIGAIRLRVRTKDAADAGTDSLVQASILRDGNEIRLFGLDYATENDLERGAARNYDYLGPVKLPRHNDKTPELPPGVGRTPMPYPDWGFEFSNGMKGHLKVRLRINGDDLWIEDSVELHVKQIRLKNTSFDTLAWTEDADWSHVASWKKDVVMSTDSSEGLKEWTLSLS